MVTSDEQEEFILSLVTYHLSLFLRRRLYLNNFAALVVTALGADAMCHARLLAIRAKRCLRRTKRIMRATLART